jgi:serine phosphatase RsbU (regulator of sigma subunit)/anti-sigma regulatory factor (Ser/Thr protein kinase)
MMSAAKIRAPGSLRLSVACDLDNVRPLARQARAFLTGYGISENDVMACELVLVEACNNAVQYATDEGQNQPIEVEISCDEQQVELCVHDHTRGFVMPKSCELPHAESESGRGLFIMRSLMDNLRYSSGRAKNSLIMTMNRTGSTPSDRVAPRTMQEMNRKLAESDQIISEMAEELSSCYETLSAIFRCGADLGKANNIRAFTRSLCDDLLQITDSDWYLLRIISPVDAKLGVFVSSNPDIKLDPLPLIPADKSTAVAEVKSATTKYDVWFNAVTPLLSSDPLNRFSPGSFGVVHPFFFADNPMGTLAVGKSANKAAFTAVQAHVIHTFADFLAIQIMNAQLQEEQLKSRLVSRELEIARTIQQALLPKTLPQLGNFRLAGFCESARQVGGDFYDVVKVNDDSILLMIADVMGKGIPAAMFAAILRSILRGTPEYNQQPAALLTRVNRLLFEELSEVEMFITAQLVYIDFAKRELIAASAGHCPILLGAPCSPNVKRLTPDGMPLGILPETPFSEEKHVLELNTRLLLYTDGLTDAHSGTGQFFGEERLLKWFERGAAQQRTAEELKASLVEELKKFQSQTAVYDDQTFLILAEENSERRPNVPEDFGGRS